MRSFYLQLLHNFTYHNLYFDLHSRTRHQFSDEFEIRELSHQAVYAIWCPPSLSYNGWTNTARERVPYDNPYICIGHINKGLDINKIGNILDDFTNSTKRNARTAGVIGFAMPAVLTIIILRVNSMKESNLKNVETCVPFVTLN